VSSDRVVVIGAGPAGLTSAYELTKHGVPVVVLEQDPVYVGGLARTAEHRGYRFDIGGHRFFSKNQEIEDLWTEILADDMITCRRLSRIYYRGRYFDYPIAAVNALVNLGLLEAARCALSYTWARLFPIPEARTFETWARNRFGFRLYSIFFRTYTEKVWGVPTRQLSADWAAQRIKGLDLGQVIRQALWPCSGVRASGDVIKTLIDRFRYPRRGPGQLWERTRDILLERGQEVRLGHRVVALHHDSGRALCVTAVDEHGERYEVAGGQFISSAPLRELVAGLSPPAPEPVRRAAAALGYRDFLTVALVIDRPRVFPDNWIYIHEPGVRVGRIQNFKNWSGDMVPDLDTTCLGLEYFCFEDDDLWSRPDEDLVRLATDELVRLGIVSARQVRDGVVVRQPKAYPVYDERYGEHVAVIRSWLECSLPNLHLVGRNGMHKYNNQDHSMLTALLVARNIACGTRHDHWQVNADAEYHEEIREADGVLPPSRVIG
jgi:protoporphyrinogen oxidase